MTDAPARIEIADFKSKAMPHTPGEHLWVMIPMFRVNPTATRVYLDRENLITVEGPGCFWCEQPWSEAVAQRPCVRK